MIVTTAADVAALAGGTLHGDADAPVGPGVVIDARQATPGSLFIAIPGERVDGHDFAGQAVANGAAAILGTRVTDAEVPHIVVAESVAGLSQLAKGVIARAKGAGLTVLAVTGSSGKTSTKDLLAQVLEAAAPTVSPVGSFNNEIGVPLTACQIDADTRYLVSEMGARGIGHLSWLTGLIPPDISLVLNVGTAHLGEFGGVDNIAQAKGELIEALDADGWAVLNLGDQRVAAMASRTTARVAYFTRSPYTSADASLVVRANHVSADDLQRPSFDLVVEAKDAEPVEFPVQLKVLGEHQVWNALAAATAAICAGVAPQIVAQALNQATTRSKWRMQLDVRADGAAILNDSYNANPDSMAAALRTLAMMAEERKGADPHARGYAVLGDMLELGDDAATEHRRVGQLAAELGIDEVFAVGNFAPDIVAGVTNAGGKARAVAKQDVASQLALAAMDVVVVKASRGMALDEVAAQLLAGGGTSC